MTIDTGRVTELAALARLRLSPDEIERARQRIDALLSSFDSIAAVDTDGVAPHGSRRSDTLRGREDRPTAPLPRDTALANAARSLDGQFIVPRVIER